jgi:hypothetical protein
MKHKLKLVVSNKVTHSRPFLIDYAGAWKGHAITWQNAVNAAGRHVVLDAYNKATITDKRTGEPLAWVHVNPDRRGYTVKTARVLRKVER